jgi:hypothetical protein
MKSVTPVFNVLPAYVRLEAEFGDRVARWFAIGEALGMPHITGSMPRDTTRVVSG